MNPVVRGMWTIKVLSRFQFQVPDLGTQLSDDFLLAFLRHVVTWSGGHGFPYGAEVSYQEWSE